ncbi:transposase [Rhizobium calliandrae]|uniref:Transposase n=1 Tax=Rhizobium calliandrae TaxID=1312182 RepID=A0ABT7KL69_9HYPH|nr:transposase [Rhizobium calliandrae]MDL2409379.1 transposase [Rhizobium calliandrae]
MSRMILRGFRYKLAPTPEQEALFRQFSGVCRLVYNLALEQRRDWWRQYEANAASRLNYIAQARELTMLRAGYDWIAAVSQTCQQQALRDLDKAFANFFSGRARYPSPRRKGVNDSFRFQGREVETKRLNGKWSAVRLPKIGWVRFCDTRPRRGTIKNVTVALDALGWHVSFACEIEHVAPANSCPCVGIDRGVVNTLTLSTGETLSLPSCLDAIDRRKRGAQRTLARKKRGSARHAKALRRVARLSARAARIRRDWQHKTALNIARCFGVVALEDLSIRTMTASARGTIDEPGRHVRQKAGLNRSILSQGWGAFETILAYKLEERGGTLVTVDPAYTSQTCSDCATVDKQSRESQAAFACTGCGFCAHADHNAAINILRRNTASTIVEEGHKLSVEAITGRGYPPPENPPASAGGGC